jgi:hypothetical protein
MKGVIMASSAEVEAASILVAAGLYTYEELGITPNAMQSHLKFMGEAEGRKLKYCPADKERVIRKCLGILGLSRA